MKTTGKINAKESTIQLLVPIIYLVIMAYNQNAIAFFFFKIVRLNGVLYYIINFVSWVCPTIFMLDKLVFFLVSQLVKLFHLPLI